MPVIPGYHVEIKATETYYSRTAKARLVKDEYAESISTTKEGE